VAQVRQYINTILPTPTLIPGVFVRVASEGDASRFYGAETGKSQVVSIHSTSTVKNGSPQVTRGTDAIGVYTDFILDFDYIVASNQLQIYIANYNGSNPATTKITFSRIPSIDERLSMIGMQKTSGASPTSFVAADFPSFYEERTSNSVRIYGADKDDSTYQTGLYLFSVPHTSIPASVRNKVIVQDQGDNEAAEFRGFGDGFAMRAPNGSKWLVRVDNSGVLVVEPR
jgi:hypothetical protein